MMTMYNMKKKFTYEYDDMLRALLRFISWNPKLSV